MNKFKPGDIFYSLFIGPRYELKPYKCHILAIVDKEYVVYKWWSIYKRYWRYSIEHYEIIEINNKRAKDFKK